MPTKHVVKEFDAPAFYHVYNRASGERLLFRDDLDRTYFLQLLQKHLLENEAPAEIVRVYDIEIVAYCLMGTHFHLLLYQEADPEAITGYMRSVSTAYSMYYNRKYRSKGHVFQSSYRASRITNEAYLAHISRYIHLNPRSYLRYKWSSYQEYVGRSQRDIIHPERVIDDPDAYAQFVANYALTNKKVQYKEIKDLLAS